MTNNIWFVFENWETVNSFFLLRHIMFHPWICIWMDLGCNHITGCRLLDKSVWRHRSNGAIRFLERFLGIQVEMHGHIVRLTDNYVIQIILGIRSQIPAQLLGVIIFEAVFFFGGMACKTHLKSLFRWEVIVARPVTFGARRKIYISIQYGKPTMWAPKIAKLVYNSNNYGLWYL